LYEVLKVILKKKDSMFHGSEEAKNLWFLWVLRL
jgi:hypothetical protein